MRSGITQPCSLCHRLYETFDENAEIYIVTELVEGGELFDRIVSKTSYTEKEARDLIRLLLDTLAYMHANGIVHRDLKPENLLLCSESDDSDIKIADFGFAKRITDLTAKETACGTPGYVAPEILRGDSYGAEVDIWSMGVICYVLLAGYPPFYDEDQKKLFKKIKEGRYYFHDEYWSNTSPEAIDLIKMMLCVDQSKRWSAAQLLKHPWILLGDDALANKSLPESIVTMRKFNARRRLKAAADAVIMANRLSRMGFVSRLRQQLSIEEEEEAAAASQRQNHVITESQRRSSMDVAAPVLFDLNPIDPALAAAATAPATHS
jgi:calcium/calmodulin-dependent protein kinase I